MAWWGPSGVVCIGVEVDLRVGGRYRRIGNRMPDKQVVWIEGEFELINCPSELKYSWCVGTASPPAERVHVRFVPLGEMTEVIVEHEQIPTRELRDSHQRGWQGCLDGLARYLSD